MADPKAKPEPDTAKHVSPEAIVRRVALGVLPLLVLIGYLLRSQTPSNETQPTTPSAQVPSTKRATPLPEASRGTTEFKPTASAIRLYGERAASSSEPAPLPSPSVAPPATPAHQTKAVAAVDLPSANLAPGPTAPSIVTPQSPCGGLFVRLITFTEDKKLSFASIAPGYAEPAQVLHIGESIGGYQVTGIEWDRVWVQGAGERCALGMHFGVREAEQQAAKELSAEDYAKLPWVLPHTIVTGIDKRAEMDFIFDEQAIAALYKRGADVFAGLRLKEVGQQNSELRGLELHDVRIDSFLERLGIEAGDVLVSIDDKPIQSIADVLSALESARSAEQLVAGFIRHGEPFELVIKARSQ